MKTLAVIPARGGSKRIPKKNIRSFLGKPIIAYSIEAALNSGLFDDVIVSTEDEEIADISKQYGASIPFLRPVAYANDSIGVLAVLAQVLTELARLGQNPSEVCMVYATAPMIRVSDLVKSYEKFCSTDKAFVFSAAQFASPIFRAFEINDDGSAKLIYPNCYHKRSQDLPPAFHDAAQFVWGNPEAIQNPDSVLFSEISLPYLLPSYRVVDIDTPEDWQHAELLYQANLKFDKNYDEGCNSR